MLPNGVRNYIRKMTEQALTSRCTIQQEEEIIGSFGQPEMGWIDVQTNLPCRIITAGQSSQEESETFASQDAIEETYRLIVAHDVTLGTDMRVTVDGATYYIVQLETSLTDKAFRSAVMLRKAGADG